MDEWVSNTIIHLSIHPTKSRLMKTKKIIAWLPVFVTALLNAQNIQVDKVLAVVGDNIILQSDV